MLQFFHRFQKHVMFIVLLLAIVMAMSGFGLNLGRGGSSQTKAAIKVNEIEVSHEQVREAIRNTEFRYRQMFGKSYEQFAKQLAQNIPQQVTDDLIDQSVILSQARKLGFIGGKEGVKKLIKANFPNDPSFTLYKAYLNQANKSAAQFESDLAEDVVRTQFQQLVRDSATLSQLEIERAVQRKQTTYTVASLEFDPQSQLSKVATPTEEQVKAYYEEHAADYELAPRANYRFITFEAKNFLNSVAIDADTIAIEYEERKNKYQAPEEFKARHIQFNYSSKSDVKQMADVKERAKRALDRIKAGESFEKLAEEYSDDITTRNFGGDLGWIKQGHVGPEFDQALANLKKGELSDVVSASYGFHVIRLDDHNPARVLTLDEAKAKVEQDIREREAPAYTAEHAHVLLDKWLKSGVSLEEFARSNSLSIKDSGGLLAKDKDPEGALPGMTAKVLEGVQGVKGAAIEIKDDAALVEIIERRAAEIPTLDIVRDSIVEKLRLESAKTATRSQAQDLLSKLADNSLVDAAKTISLTATVQEYSPDKPSPGVLAQEDIGRAISAATKTPTNLSQVFQAGSKYVVVQVTAIKTPKLEELKEQLKQSSSEEQRASAELLFNSVLAGLKAKADIKSTL